MDGTMVKTSIRPNVITTYHWDKPIGSFRFPVDTMRRLRGHENMSYDDLVAFLIGQEEYWWAARVYKNYNGLLDMYIQWCSDSRVHHYVLDFDPLWVTIGNDYDGWPAPKDFYLARAALCTGTSWPTEEYNRLSQPPVPMHPPADDEAPIDEEGGVDIAENEFDQAAIKEGGAAIDADTSAVAMKETNIDNAAEAHAAEAMTPSTAIESPIDAKYDEDRVALNLAIGESRYDN